MILQIKGGTSSLELYDDYLVIKPSNVQKLSGSTQTIPLDSVVTVSIVKSFLQTPYLQIITPGLVPGKKDNLKGAEANVVLIQPGNMAKAKQVQAYVAQYKAGGKQASGNAPASNLDELKKLAELKDQGIITQEEFDAKKKQLLNL